MENRKLAIVGAGVSGLLAYKYALSKGYQPIVFESKSSLGGVWMKTFETTRLRTPTFAYRFTDFPWPSSVKDTFPKSEQVLEYMQAYAENFGLLTYIRFNSKVISLDYEGPCSDDEMEAWSQWGGCGEAFSNQGRWKLEVLDRDSQSIEVVQADLVVLCVGRFSDIPDVPKFPPQKGPDVFCGRVMHSLDYANLDNQSSRGLIKGKRVVVVGFHKSAIDLAMEFATANGKENPCTLIIRTPHWTVTDYTHGKFLWLFYTYTVSLSY